MSPGILCRLCISSSYRFKSLLDDTGQLNRVYEIAVKYFDPMILQSENDYYVSVICIECWQQINDFHTFQQSITNSQAKLINYKRPIVLAYKLDDQLKAPHMTKAKRKKPNLNDIPKSLNKESIDILISNGQNVIKCHRIIEDKHANDDISNELTLAASKKDLDFLIPICSNTPQTLPCDTINDKLGSPSSVIYHKQGPKIPKAHDCIKCNISIKGNLSFKLHMLKVHNIINQEYIKKPKEKPTINSNNIQPSEFETNTNNQGNTLQSNECRTYIRNSYYVQKHQHTQYMNTKLNKLSNNDPKDTSVLPDTVLQNIVESSQPTTLQNIVKSSQPTTNNINLPELYIFDVKMEHSLKTEND